MLHTSLPALLMGLLAALCLVVALVYLKKALRLTSWPQARQRKIFIRTTALVVGWLVLIGALSLKGFFIRLDVLPPRPVLFVLLPLPFVLVLAFSKPFKTLALAIPEHWCVVFQSFRILVELLLWMAFLQGIVPVQMTFEGRNFDILAGAGALVAGIIMRRQASPYTTGLVYNIAGLALLLNILVVSVLSMPTPLRYFMNEPSVEAVGRFPFIYLPTVLVVLAYTFHIFSLRQLALKRNGTAAFSRQRTVPAGS